MSTRELIATCVISICVAVFLTTWVVAGFINSAHRDKLNQQLTVVEVRACQHARDVGACISANGAF